MSRDAIQIDGQVSQHARVAFRPNTTPPAADLVLQIQPAKGLPYLIALPLGTDPGRHNAAHAKERLLRQGQWVRVYASHLQIRMDHDTQALRVEGVTDVIPFNQPAHHSEAATAQES